MTCKEKLAIEHPDNVDEGYLGDCCGCPHEYGYLDTPEYCVAGNEESCTRCWNREIPEVAPDIWEDMPVDNEVKPAENSDPAIRCYDLRDTCRPNWENMYEKATAENTDLKLKLEELTEKLDQKEREIEILRGMLRTVESFNGGPILQYIKIKSGKVRVL